MRDIVIIGGGMVGVSCALNLQERGYAPTIIEQNRIGGETSYGNAGVITRSSIIPLNNPALIKKLYRYVGNQNVAIRYNLSYAVKNSLSITRFLLNSLDKKAVANMHALDQLISHSLGEHEKWMALAGASQHLRKTGFLKLFRSQASFEASAFERRLLTQFGVKYRVVDDAEIKRLEPHLKDIFYNGVLIEDAASVDNPGQVVERYGTLFEERGGEVLNASVREVKNVEGGFLISTSHGSIEAERVVVSAGPWSQEILKSVGFKLPMFLERGYHYHFERNDHNGISRPILDAEGGYVMTPTSMGIRVSSGSELNDRDQPSNESQIDRAIKSAMMALDIDKKIDKVAWRGSRPTLPDSLPAIGPVPGKENLWVACGHQHIGFSTGPATGRLIADMVSGGESFVPAAPYLASRFQ
ncbi:NAD(P)/FAD-dependent oxidoreductase [Halomonas sp. HNIBRBA4712]|uniref:NAD(P)/FAD-dependent oxidoreductase n=1 Tax=Halomonas sp. HNIBRBA4712 TaxID=3373087 RepID=UPI00374679A0